MQDFPISLKLAYRQPGCQAIFKKEVIDDLPLDVIEWTLTDEKISLKPDFYEKVQDLADEVVSVGEMRADEPIIAFFNQYGPLLPGEKTGGRAGLMEVFGFLAIYRLLIYAINYLNNGVEFPAIIALALSAFQCDHTGPLLDVPRIAKMPAAFREISRHANQLGDIIAPPSPKMSLGIYESQKFSSKEDEQRAIRKFCLRLLELAVSSTRFESSLVKSTGRLQVRAMPTDALTSAVLQRIVTMAEPHIPTDKAATRQANVYAFAMNYFRTQRDRGKITGEELEFLRGEAQLYGGGVSERKVITREELKEKLWDALNKYRVKLKRPPVKG
jgi:hypothetical protein